MGKIPGFSSLQIIRKRGPSVVYRGRRNDDSALILLYTLAANLLSPADVEAFMNTCDLIKKIDSEGIVRIHEIRKINNLLAVVMEDDQSPTLQDVLQQGKMKLSEFFPIALRLPAILGTLHRYNVVHGGINPQCVHLKPVSPKIRVVEYILSPFRGEFGYNGWDLHETDAIENVLPYLSPERTGRLRRSPDQRSDLYSLGVVFYRMLTGIVPFQSDNPFEILKSHMNKKPVAPSELNHDIPAVISDIVMKLLEKEPEHRYQTAEGLLEDINRCSADFTKKGSVVSFPLARRDVPTRFQISNKFYGRDLEADLLKKVFERIPSTGREIISVSGPSGIGKTALVLDIFKPIVECRGYFISGKCDQSSLNLPYNAIVQAFQDLIGQLLAESREGIQLWKEAILAATGPNGRVLVDVIPDIELIIGPQPELSPLKHEESQNRFKMVFSNFIKIFSMSKRPLVLFIDDIQWVDSATLFLLKYPLADPGIESFLLIWAYRDGEVSEYHSLMLAASEIRNSGISVTHLSPAPLDVGDVILLLMDTLRCGEAKARPLADLITKCSAGNPLVIHQM